MADLATDIQYIKGVGEARAKGMAKLGIQTLRDLVSFFPRAYEDRTVIKPISLAVPDETVCIRAMAAAAPRLSHIRKGLDLVKVRVVDEGGAMDITFFNQSFVKDAIKPGEVYVFYGKVAGTARRPEMTNPVFERETTRNVTGRIMPVYRLTAGLSQNILAGAARQGLEACGEALPDYLPEAVREGYKLAQARYAYENIHFPLSFEALEIARRRLIFEELFIISAAMGVIRKIRTVKPGRGLKDADMDVFYAALPFTLTGAQKRSIEQAVSDMKRPTPMNRLVQGDVGSGKTVVAAACCWFTWKSGCQSAFMAPTEILAEQHYRSLSALLEPLGIQVGLLTGSMTPKQKKTVQGQLRLGELDVIIGTHALLSEGVEFFDLALVVTDEQHRFGVGQRSALTAKGDSPHVLVMSATPIPRTLALIIYGDLDVSVIDELPPGRQKVETYTAGEKLRQRTYNFMRKLVGEGRQVYVVCPMVEESETADADLKSAQEYAARLQQEIFPDLRVALVHGRMKPKEKERVMSAFAAGQTDILVATTVIEVGVDVPNAALMVVENADRFGLSQLHQLRGRVGRGEHQSYCILFEGAGGEVSRERLKIMCSTNDGFKISEEDLKLRGPGDFFGSRQHGLPEMHIASLAADMDVLTTAQAAASEVLKADPALSRPANKAMKERIDTLFELRANTLN
ncbi:ATP-dependent DNA helicase RecG [Sporobacter termitidis DSM 10068]|uniref:ATP-dependent DNA helicase RecG n=1 Tax=Sporobacter termitidis DSM 10068 TaxID=1123282 RepID=A0A1M5TWI5_9FIRM|nr:ATP-dependent DNA helicase RecG [Sporobacter termitidis]SHH55162.1 ATP-dependent DNA helicase RecG [Sporobacter termitidis DSM 10068]